MPGDTVLWVVLGFALGGFVQGLTGFGFVLVCVAVWAGQVPPALAAPLAVAGSFAGQVVSIQGVWRRFEWQRALPFLAGGAVGVPPGVWLAHHVDVQAFRLGVGLLLVLWCPAMLWARMLPRVTAGGRAADAAVGVVGGVLGGLGGLTGPAPTLWCTLRGWERDVQRGVYQSFTLTMQALTLAGYALSGGIGAGTLRLGLFALPAMTVAALLGLVLYRRIDDAAFRRAVLVMLSVTGAVLVVSSVRAMLG